MFTALRRYAEFKGRSRRSEYWLFHLMCFLGAMVLMSVAISMGALTAFEPGGASSGLYVLFACAAIVLGLVVPSWSVQVRRLHDIDRSGWWALLGLVPYLGPIVLLVLNIFDGTKGDNRFGPDPKNRQPLV